VVEPMSTHYHDPDRFVDGLAGRLASRSRHVRLFLGAGAARACGLPDVGELQRKILDKLAPPDAERFSRQLQNRNLEGALSRLRRIYTLLEGEDRVDGLAASEARELDAKVCQAVVRLLDIEHANLGPMRMLASWMRRADYHAPLEVFTVNYDLLIETALEELRVPYFDGFIGALRARFHRQLVEEWPDDESMSQLPAKFVRLWKLHGSVNWEWTKETPREIVRRGEPVPHGTAAAIYPSDMKYEESRRVPFVVLQDRFRRSLHKPEVLTIITGYSFSDQHINEIMFDAAQQRPRSEFIAFCYDSIPEAVAEFATNTPNFQVAAALEAIIGGRRGMWRPPKEGRPGTWLNDKFALHDFTQLAAYLGRSVGADEVRPLRVREVVAQLGLQSASTEPGDHPAEAVLVVPEARLGNV